MGCIFVSRTASPRFQLSWPSRSLFHLQLSTRQPAFTQLVAVRKNTTKCTLRSSVGPQVSAREPRAHLRHELPHLSLHCRRFLTANVLFVTLSVARFSFTMFGFRGAALAWFTIWSSASRVSALIYEEKYVGYNLNTNTTATSPHDYWGEWEGVRQTSRFNPSPPKFLAALRTILLCVESIMADPRAAHVHAVS